MGRSPNLNISNGEPLVPWLRAVLKHLVRRASSIINSDFVTESYILCQYSKDKHQHFNFRRHNYDGYVSMATSLLIGHLRSAGTSIIPTPSHPEPASHNRSSSIAQSSWKGGEVSPGLCSREEGQHRRKVVVGSSNSSSNHKCLQRFNMWVGPVSPLWEEQNRHGSFYSPAVGVAPRQSR